MWANADEPDERRLRVDRPVQGLGHVVADRGQPLDPPLGQTLVSHLQLQVRDDRRQVGVAGALPQPVERALHVTGTGFDRSDRVGDRTAGVVVAVDPDDRVVADVGLHVGDDLSDLVRQRATVRVAQHEVRGAVDDRGLDRPERELRVLAVAVEEVLQVDEHLAALSLQERDGIGDHRRAFVERRLQRLDHLVLGALRHDADGRGVRLDQVAQRGVVVAPAAWAARRAECDQRRGRQVELALGALEELDVLGIRPRPAAFDEVHAEQVELLRDAEFVVDRRRDALDLEAVAECGVEDFDESHGGSVLSMSERRLAQCAAPVKSDRAVDFNAEPFTDGRRRPNCIGARCGRTCDPTVHCATEPVEKRWMNRVDLGATRKVLWVTL